MTETREPLVFRRSGPGPLGSPDGTPIETVEFRKGFAIPIGSGGTAAESEADARRNLGLDAHGAPVRSTIGERRRVLAVEPGVRTWVGAQLEGGWSAGTESVGPGYGNDLFPYNVLLAPQDPNHDWPATEMLQDECLFVPRQSLVLGARLEIAMTGVHSVIDGGALQLGWRLDPFATTSPGAWSPETLVTTGFERRRSLGSLALVDEPFSMELTLTSQGFDRCQVECSWRASGVSDGVTDQRVAGTRFAEARWDLAKRDLYLRLGFRLNGTHVTGNQVSIRSVNVLYRPGGPSF